MTGLEILPGLFVSRETYESLKTFEQLVAKWSSAINLVSKRDQCKIWERHVTDSVQIYRLLPDFIKNYVDLGSGAGFPGIVVAIMLKELRPSTIVNLVESDKRKSAFLTTVSAKLSLNVRVNCKRIERADLQLAKVISARALGDLNYLLYLSAPYLDHDGFCLFFKGKCWQKELEGAQKEWNFDLEVIKSKVKKGAVILKVRSISRA